MTKLEIEAIKALPESFVADETFVAVCSGIVVAMRKDTIPMKYLPDTKSWTQFDGEWKKE